MKKSLSSLFFFCLYFSLNTHAVTFLNPNITTEEEWISTACSAYENNGLKKIDTPIDYSQPTKKMPFYYLYQVQSSNQPTVIYIPGGPGGHTIAHAEDESFKKLKEIGLNVLLIDPRGNGCNFFTEGFIPNEQISSENIAKDIFEVIKIERLDNYILWGHSYGTLIGTILADLIRKAEYKKPKALVLEGTLGKSESSSDDADKNYVDVINKILKTYPQFMIPFLNRNIFFQGEGNIWGELWKKHIDKYLSQPQEPNQPTPFLDFFSLYPKSLLDEELKNYFFSERDFILDDQKWRSQQKDLKNMRTVYAATAIVCQEMFDDLLDRQIVSIDSTGASLKPQERPNMNNLCDHFKKRKTKFNSADYDVGVPTIYFQGEWDPQTTIKNAIHHKRHNKSATIFVKLKESGHAPLSVSLFSCYKDLWLRISRQQFDFSSLLNKDGLCARDPWKSPFSSL